MTTGTKSRRYRRMQENAEYRAQVREILFETEYELPSPRISDSEAVDLILSVVDSREETLRQVIAMMAADLGVVYEYIDERLLLRERPGTYARGQQLMLQRLRDRMNSNMSELYDSKTGTWISEGLFEITEPPF
jgi:hypothetical protein